MIQRLHSPPAGDRFRVGDFRFAGQRVFEHGDGARIHIAQGTAATAVPCAYFTPCRGHSGDGPLQRAQNTVLPDTLGRRKADFSGHAVCRVNAYLVSDRGKVFYFSPNSEHLFSMWDGGGTLAQFAGLGFHADNQVQSVAGFGNDRRLGNIEREARVPGAFSQ